MAMKCRNCGSTAQYKEISRVETNTTIEIIYSCGCGYRHEEVWKKQSESGWYGNTRYFSKKYK